MRVLIGALVWMLGFGVESAWALDTTRYQELKALKVLTLSKTPDGVVVASTAHYDSQTGKPIPSTVEGVSVDALLAQKAVLQAQIAQIDAVLADIKALP